MEERVRLGVVVAAVAAALLLIPFAGSAWASPGSGPTAAVSLGDSYISGEAGRWLGNSNELSFGRGGTDLAWDGHRWDKGLVYGDSAHNGCHRSRTAEIRSSYLPGIQARFDLACSGATTAAVRHDRFKGEAPQVDQLAPIADHYDVRLIVLSIGGNDLGFPNIVRDTIKAWTLNQSAAHHHQEQVVRDVFPTAMANVRQTIERIQRAMAHAGYSRDDYRFVLQSYPSPVPPAHDARYPQHGWTRLTEGGCPLWDADLNWAHNRLVPQIARGLHAEAGLTGVTFLDLRRALDGREVCSKHRHHAWSGNPPSPQRSEWVRFLAGILQGDFQEAFHPNAYGQIALGQCLTELANASGTDFGCEAAGPGPHDMRLHPIAGPPVRLEHQLDNAAPHELHNPWPPRYGFLPSHLHHLGHHLPDPPPGHP